MRAAFVVQLGPETKPSEGRFEGWVQEVDSCREQRFCSSEELLKFMGQRFDLVKAPANEIEAGLKNEQGLATKKACKKKKDTP